VPPCDPLPTPVPADLRVRTSRNERSRGALLALGAQYEGTFRKHRVLPGGGVRHSAYYSVIDDEWPAVRARLQRRLAA
jgi:hypothetical protein